MEGSVIVDHCQIGRNGFTECIHTVQTETQMMWHERQKVGGVLYFFRDKALTFKITDKTRNVWHRKILAFQQEAWVVIVVFAVDFSVHSSM